MPDQDPKRKPKSPPSTDAKPVRDRETDFGLGPDLPDLDGPQGVRDLTAPEKPRDSSREPAAEPDRPTAAADKTRSKTSGISLPDQLRGYLDRLGDIEDEIDDTEAARRAGLAAADGEEPRPPEYQDLPAVMRNDLAGMATDIMAGGEQHPEWHTINNLPGYMKNAIRAMGRGNFRMFTRTPLEQITTIANVNGQGPNTDREIQAVAAWLQKNAENLGAVDIDYGQIMPGYEPEVIEFRTEKTRFHLVRDPAGQYIYAYPEKDAVERTNTASLPGPDSGDDERDEFGARIKRISKENKMENKFSSITEQIRYYTDLLESLQDQSLEESQTNELLEALLEASSLGQTLRGAPGAASLVRYLHRQHRLGSAANYVEVPDRLHATLIKANRDNFAIIVGSTGVAGIKPLEADWMRSQNPKDNTMRYVVVWSTEEQAAESEIQKYRLGRRDATGGTSGAEGGAPNLFQVLLDRIGPTQKVFVTTEAVERAKVAQRKKYQTATNKWEHPPLPDSDREPVLKKDAARSTDPTDMVADRLKPILSRLLNQAVGNIQQRVQKLSQAGNFQQATELSRSGAHIQAMLTALDTDNPDYDSYGSPLRSYKSLIQDALGQLYGTLSREERAEAIKSLAQGQAKELGDLLNVVRQKLYKIR